MFKTIITMYAASSIFSGTAYAAESYSEKADKAVHQAKDVVSGVSINSIGAQGEVTISGKVAYIDKLDNEFTVEDETGSIDVEQTGDLMVNVGDEVTVSGTITDDMGEKEIAASKVSITKQARMSEDNS